MHWMLLPFKRYFDFQGRSRRLEFWMFSLLNVIVAALTIGLAFAVAPSTSTSELITSGDSFAATAGYYSNLSESPLATGLAALYGLYALGIFIPSIAVTVRRLHDRNMSGWWYLGFAVFGLIPLIGFLSSLAFLVVMFLPGTPGPNRFGSDPKFGGDAAVFE